jgi:rubrerythrin
MREMTRKFLGDAFAGESQAHMKYMIFAAKAKEEGFENVARLFEAIGFAELVHARNHLQALGQVGTTGENLQKAIDGETYEVEEMYPAFKTVAELQNESGAVRSMRFALEAEKIHASMYTRAKQAVEEGRDLELDKIYICGVCGYTTETKPDRCPVCGAGSEKFREF